MASISSKWALDTVAKAGKGRYRAWKIKEEKVQAQQKPATQALSGDWMREELRQKSRRTKKSRFQRQAIIRFLFFLKGASTWSSCQQGNQWSTMIFDISFTQSSVSDPISFTLNWGKVFRSMQMACLCITSKLYNKKGHTWHLWQKWSFKKIPSNFSFTLPGVLLGRPLLMRNLSGKSSSLTKVLFRGETSG